MDSCDLTFCPAGICQTKIKDVNMSTWEKAHRSHIIRLQRQNLCGTIHKPSNMGAQLVYVHCLTAFTGLISSMTLVLSIQQT